MVARWSGWAVPLFFVACSGRSTLVVGAGGSGAGAAGAGAAAAGAAAAGAGSGGQAGRSAQGGAAGLDAPVPEDDGRSGSGGLGEAGADDGPRCGEPPLGARPAEAFSCPNGTVTLHRSCSEEPVSGFEGTLDGEPLALRSASGTVPGTVSVSRRACGGGPLTFVITFALGGAHAGDVITLYANASQDCLIQAVYLPAGAGEGERLGVELSLDVWEEEFGPSFLRGDVSLTGEPGGYLAPSLSGSFTVLTTAEPCFT